MRHSFRNLWRLALLAAVAAAASGCVVDPGYGYAPAYYGPPATVYVGPAYGYYGYHGYYHGGYGYGYHHWH